MLVTAPTSTRHKPYSTATHFAGKPRRSCRSKSHHSWRYPLQSRGSLQYLESNQTRCSGHRSRACDTCARHFRQFGVEVCHDLRKALDGVDAVMLLRIQHERQNSTHFPQSARVYSNVWPQQRTCFLAQARCNHHAPRSNKPRVEIDSQLADSDRSVILQQVTNGIAVMAVLYLCMNAQERKDS